MTTLRTGIVAGMSEDEYHAIKAVSATALKAGRRSLAHMRYQMEVGREPSKAMLFGSLVDCLVFEPESFGGKYDATDLNLATKDGIKFKAAAHERGLEVIKRKDFDAAMAASLSIREHPEAARLLNAPGIAQAVALWIDKETGLYCKARIDRYVAGIIALDLKTTKDASPFAFGRQCASLGYHLQVAWYAQGFQAVSATDTPFVLIAVDNEPPFAAAVYSLPADMVAVGHRSCRNILAAFAKAQKSGEWPGYSRSIEELPMPAWAARDEMPLELVEDQADEDHSF